MKNNIRENKLKISELENNFILLKNENNDKYNYLKSQYEKKNNNLFNEVNSKFFECDLKLEEMNKKLNDNLNDFNDKINKKIVNNDEIKEEMNKLENKFNNLMTQNENNIIKEIDKIKKENLTSCSECFIKKVSLMKMTPSKQ